MARAEGGHRRGLMARAASSPWPPPPHCLCSSLAPTSLPGHPTFLLQDSVHHATGPRCHRPERAVSEALRAAVDTARSAPTAAGTGAGGHPMGNPDLPLHSVPWAGGTPLFPFHIHDVTTFL